MPREIVLAGGETTQVSEEDFAYLVYWRWFKDGDGYVRRTDSSKRICMHSVIAERAGFPGVVDHKDRNSLNNQRENLRPATGSQNQANRLTSVGRSGYRGVLWEESRRMWKAKIQVNSKYIHIGYFHTKEQAAIAYNIEAKKHFGDFAVLNEVQ